MSSGDEQFFSLRRTTRSLTKEPSPPQESGNQQKGGSRRLSQRDSRRQQQQDTSFSSEEDSESTDRQPSRRNRPAAKRKSSAVELAEQSDSFDSVFDDETDDEKESVSEEEVAVPKSKDGKAAFKRDSRSIDKASGEEVDAIPQVEGKATADGRKSKKRTGPSAKSPPRKTKTAQGIAGNEPRQEQKQEEEEEDRKPAALPPAAFAATKASAKRKRRPHNDMATNETAPTNVLLPNFYVVPGSITHKVLEKVGRMNPEWLRTEEMETLMEENEASNIGSPPEDKISEGSEEVDDAAIETVPRSGEDSSKITETNIAAVPPPENKPRRCFRATVMPQRTNKTRPNKFQVEIVGGDHKGEFGFVVDEVDGLWSRVQSYDGAKNWLVSNYDIRYAPESRPLPKKPPPDSSDDSCAKLFLESLQQFL